MTIDRNLPPTNEDFGDDTIRLGDILTLDDGMVCEVAQIRKESNNIDLYYCITPTGQLVHVHDSDILEVQPGEPTTFAQTELDEWLWPELSEPGDNPFEGIDGYHNAIGGASCPRCHDQGCDQCLDRW